MRNFLSKVWNKIRPKTQLELQDEYLSQATDLADLERRMRYLQNHNLKGWV